MILTCWPRLSASLGARVTALCLLAVGGEGRGLFRPDTCSSLIRRPKHDAGKRRGDPCASKRSTRCRMLSNRKSDPEPQRLRRAEDLRDRHAGMLLMTRVILSPRLLNLLAERGGAKHVARGEILFSEGDQAVSMFLITSGSLKVFSKNERGREVIYNLLEPGDVVGEMCLNGGKRSASVCAISAASCLEISDSNLSELLAIHPELAEALLYKLMDRLRRSTAQVRSLALDNVFSRVAACVDEMAIVDGNVRYLPSYVTQQQIAARVGATREMVNHVFRGLVRSKILRRDRRVGFVIIGPLNNQA